MAKSMTVGKRENEKKRLAKREEKLKKKEAFSKEMILEVQAMVEKGASKEKIGLRGPMPPGMLFAGKSE